MTYSNNMYTFTYKEDDKVIYTGTITIDRNDNNITTYFNTTYIKFSLKRDCNPKE